MSDDYNLDNAGSGFALDDDDDLEALLQIAEAGEEEDDEGDTSSFFNEGGQAPAPQPQVHHEPQEQVQHQQEFSQMHAAPQHQPAQEEEEEDFAAFLTPQEPAAQERQQEEPQWQPEAFQHSQERQQEPVQEEPSSSADTFFDPTPAPQVVESYEREVQEEAKPAQEEVAWTPQAAHEQAPAPQEEAKPMPTAQELQAPTKPRMHIPTEADDVARVQQVIKVLDAARKLTPEERNVASQFISGGEVLQDEGIFIVKVLTADPMLSKTMRALREAKELESVERAFYVIELDRDVMLELGKLVSVFTQEDPDPDLPQSKYARQLVAAIDTLDNKSMSFVRATESVLAAAEEG